MSVRSWANEGVEPIVKHTPQDFLVRECPSVDLVPHAVATHEFLLLRKRGYTTFQAIRLVAANLDLPPGDVSYAGLKDEDGITEQVVAVPVRDTPLGRRAIRDHEDRWLEVQHYGFGDAAVTVGRLIGNAFRVILRNVDAERAGRLCEGGKRAVHFLNYYDTQRFGVPNGKKLTHTVGAAILTGDWDSALARLAGLSAPESAAAAAWQGSGRDFFLGLDPRTVAFYCAACASFEWNAALRELVASTSPEDSGPVEVDGIPFVYTRSSAEAVRVLLRSDGLPLTRYAFVDGTPHATTAPRTTVVQTVISAGDVAPDECFPGRHRVTLNFFLPSGCYATAALRQLAGYLA